MTDWPAAFAEHYGELVAWASGWVRNAYDPEALVSEAFQELYLSDTEARSPVGLWKVAIRRKFIAALRKEKVHERAIRRLLPLEETTDSEPTFLTPMPERSGTSQNPAGYGIGHVLPTIECELEGCTNTFAHTVSGQAGKQRRRTARKRFCSNACATEAQRADQCPKCGGEYDLMSGYRRCRPCTNARARERAQERREAA